MKTNTKASLEDGTRIFVVMDEITAMGSIATTNLITAKRYAKALVKSYRDRLIGNNQNNDEMRSEKIVSSQKGRYYSYWGRKAEVEEVEFCNHILDAEEVLKLKNNSKKVLKSFADKPKKKKKEKKYYHGSDSRPRFYPDLIN